MSGRAGRRGKDTHGLVILMMDEKMEPQVGKALLKGASDRLNSAFYLGYVGYNNCLLKVGVRTVRLWRRLK